jgi:hypothetical protein
MKNNLKHIYYIDTSCFIVREGYIVERDYGWNHNISIFSINRNIIDVCHDSNIFYDEDDAKDKLTYLIEQKAINNEKMINDLKRENVEFFEKLFNL